NHAKPAGWEYLGDIPGIKEEIRFFAEDEDGRMWVCGLNASPYRIKLAVAPDGKPDLSKTHVENMGERLRFKSLLGNIFTLNHKIYFTGDSATYTFNETKNHFEEAIFNHLRNFSGREDSTGKIWMATGLNRDSTQFIIATPQPNGGYQLDSSTLLPLLDQLPFNLYPDKNGIVWFLTTDGLIRYDGKIKRSVDQSYKTLIRNITSYKQSLNPDVTSDSKPPEIKFNHNSLRFEYAAPFYEQEDKIEYQTWLEGFEKPWSDWGKNTYKEYTNLSPGTYRFHVRSKNLYHKISEEASYSFTILSPWYRTWWAYVIYALIFLFAGYLILKWRIRKLKEQHRELEKTVEERTSQLSQRVAELAVINSVQEALVSEMDMQGIYDLVGERIRNTFDAQVVIIATFDHDSGTEHFRYAIEKGEKVYPNPRPFDNLRSQLIATRQSILIKNKEEAYSWFKEKVVAGTKPLQSGIF
ncbi:MAG: triple tyrosine motif-containing protein, partial [Ginsengibacter sp.]